MTLGEWFKFMEVHVQKQIVEETEKMLELMRSKALRVDQYIAEQKQAMGKGRSREMLKSDGNGVRCGETARVGLHAELSTPIASNQAQNEDFEAPEIAEQETKIAEQLRRSRGRLTIKEGERT
ncbi:hypothetical protein HID58_069569 [Brassica napus]|uniref:Uncharacterized protein n=1 Tax=Brassica napus TaxID=3708 RepID=A0ABQ7XA46_BRANA|nr:hypothetical protein HID58_090792 [Brassica napus]KAH0872207.1 hypothetical protein HID58_069569 [Brassica napus]